MVWKAIFFYTVSLIIGRDFWYSFPTFFNHRFMIRQSTFAERFNIFESIGSFKYFSIFGQFFNRLYALHLVMFWKDNSHCLNASVFIGVIIVILLSQFVVSLANTCFTIDVLSLSFQYLMYLKFSCMQFSQSS